MSVEVTPHTSHESHEVSMRIYYTIYGILMFLLVATVVAWRLDFGAWALLVAMLIAVIKAVLVIIYFMHMRVTGKLMWLWFSAGLIWLSMMMFGILTDVVMRSH